MLPNKKLQVLLSAIAFFMLSGCKSRQQTADLSATSNVNPCKGLKLIVDSYTKQDSDVTRTIAQSNSPSEGFQLTPPPFNEDPLRYPFLDDMNFARLHYDKVRWTPERMAALLKVMESPIDLKTKLQDIDFSKYVESIETHQNRYQKLASIAKPFRPSSAGSSIEPCIVVKKIEVDNEKLRALLFANNDGTETKTDPNTFVLPPRIWSNSAASYNDNAIDQNLWSNVSYVDEVINRSRVKQHPYWINIAKVKREVAPHVTDALAGLYIKHLLYSTKPSDDEFLDDLAAIRNRPIFAGKPDPIGQVLADWLWIDNEVFGQMQQKGWAPESSKLWQNEIDKRIKMIATVRAFSSQYPTSEKKPTIELETRLKTVELIRPYKSIYTSKKLEDLLKKYRTPNVGTYILMDHYRGGSLKTRFKKQNQRGR